MDLSYKDVSVANYRRCHKRKYGKGSRGNSPGYILIGKLQRQELNKQFDLVEHPVGYRYHTKCTIKYRKTGNIR